VAHPAHQLAALGRPVLKNRNAAPPLRIGGLPDRLRWSHPYASKSPYRLSFPRLPRFQLPRQRPQCLSPDLWPELPDSLFTSPFQVMVGAAQHLAAVGVWAFGPRSLAQTTAYQPFGCTRPGFCHPVGLPCLEQVGTVTRSVSAWVSTTSSATAMQLPRHWPHGFPSSLLWCILYFLASSSVGGSMLRQVTAEPKPLEAGDLNAHAELLTAGALIGPPSPLTRSWVGPTWRRRFGIWAAGRAKKLSAA